MLFPSYDGSVTDQQQEWFEEALGHITFPQGLSGQFVDVETVAEPAAPGHSDYMATLYDGVEAFTIQIRDGADELDSGFNDMFATEADLKRFFMEVVAHECGHVWSFVRITSDPIKAAVCALFTKDGQRGTTDDWWAPGAEHRDRIIEAVAEVFKDTFMPKAYRYYTLRSNWKISKADHATLMEILWRPSAPPRFQSRGTLFDASPFHYQVNASHYTIDGSEVEVEPNLSWEVAAIDTFESDGTPKNTYVFEGNPDPPNVGSDFLGTITYTLSLTFGLGALTPFGFWESPGIVSEYANIKIGGSAYDGSGESVGGQPQLPEFGSHMAMPAQPITHGVGLSYSRSEAGPYTYPYVFKEASIRAQGRRAAMVRR